MDRPGLLAVLTLWIAPPSSATDELLRWRAPASCPTREQLERAIAVDLGRPLTARDAEAVSARASARRREDRRWELSLAIEPRDAPAVQRTVVAERCELLAEAAALMIAVAIDPDILAEPHEVGVAPTSREPVDIPLAPDTDAAPRSISPPPEPAPIPPGPPRSPPTPRESAPPSRPMRAVVGVAVGVDVGALPRPAPGVMLRLGLVGRRMRGEVGAVHWFEQSVRVAGTRGGGDLRLTAAQLAACPRFALRRVELPVCGGLEIGAMRGEGIGVVTPTADRVLWLAFLADARVQWTPVPRVALGVQVGLAAPLLAARFRVRGLDADLHRAAPVAFRGAFALELRFP